MKRNGFTLIEMLVVIAIILSLLGILIAAVGAFSAVGSSTAARQMLASVELALSAYKSDFNAFPPSTGTIDTTATDYTGDGGNLLAGALFGPNRGDGVTDMGFRAAADSRVYGPYMSSKHASNLDGSGATWKLTMADSPGKKAVLYYRKYNTTTTGWAAVWGSSGRFHPADNTNLDGTDDPSAKWVADYPYGAANSDQRSRWSAFTAGFKTADFLLIYPGPDDKYGTDDDLLVNGQ